MISVIIPSYNQQPYLTDAIESVLDQYAQGELIIVDDGSTDRSLEIAQRYQTKRPDVVKVIAQTNRGLASARNTGIMNAKFDWILPLDADDMLLEGSLDFIQKFLKTTIADVVGLSFKTFGVVNQVINLIPNPTLKDFEQGNRLGYCSVIKKARLLEVGGYSSRMVEGYEDLHLWVNLLNRGAKIVTLPDLLWLYRTKSESMWTEARGKYHDKLLAQIKKDIPQWQPTF